MASLSSFTVAPMSFSVPDQSSRPATPKDDGPNLGANLDNGDLYLYRNQLNVRYSTRLRSGGADGTL